MADPVIVSPVIEKYLSRFAAGRPPQLKAMERLAESIRFPVGGGRSIAFPVVGPLVGGLLAHYARTIKARRVFELGSGYGYSAFWFARAIGPRGRVICTDGREDNRRTAEGFFRRAGLSARLDFRVGDGLQILRRESGPFDIIFIDMEKSRYPLGFHAALPKLRRGGLLIADNVLWSGRVLHPGRDAATRGLQRYTRLAMSSPRLATVIHPLRDGLAVSLKL